MNRRASLAIPLLFVLSACAHNVNPKITPAKIPTVEPPLRSLALLLITPSFEGYTTQSSSGMHRYNYRLGASAAAALTDLITESFERADVQRVTDAESIQWLAGAADTNVADFVIVPHFETGGYSEGAIEVAADVRIRLDVRSYRSTEAFSWTAEGRTSRVFTSRGGLTGSALEKTLAGLADSLRVNRAKLDLTP